MSFVIIYLYFLTPLINRFKKMKEIFTEVQKFKQWWLWTLLIGITVVPVIGLIQQLILKKPFGNNPMSDTGIILFAFTMLVILFIFSQVKLTTQIDESGIRMKFIPFTKKQLRWEDIESVQVVKYGYVGWGIRFGSNYGTIYNTQGTEGLAVKTKKGEKFVIGSAKIEQLKKTIASIALHNKK